MGLRARRARIEKLGPGATRLFSEEANLEGAFFDVGAGRVSVHSRKSPTRERANEDAAGIVTTETAVVLAVADGLGGAPAGQQASSLAVLCLAESVQTAVSEGREVRAGIIDGFETANREVLALGVGAATTLSVAEVNGGSVRFYHVGDSFILVAGNRGRVKMQTISHSPVGYGVEAGLLDERAAMYHEERHYISNVIGSNEMHIEVGSAKDLARRDTLLLASDGLSDNLHSKEIVEQVRKGELRRVTRSLALEAHERMTTPSQDAPSKPDDLTFVIYRRSQ